MRGAGKHSAEEDVQYLRGMIHNDAVASNDSSVVIVTVGWTCHLVMETHLQF